MKAQTARRIGQFRSAALALSLVAFAGLLLAAGDPGLSGPVARGLFLLLDPLILLNHLARTHTILVPGLLALIPVALTLVFGRFFCGWLCPLGAVHEFFSRIAGRRHGAIPPPNRSRLGLKLQILVFVLVAAVAGTSLVGWLDPMAFFTRSSASGILPAGASLFPAAKDAARVSVQPVMIGALFVLVVALNAWKRRFFCNTLCPLGALYGLLARLGVMRLEAGAVCNRCRACARRCPYDGGPDEHYLKSECVACLHCVQDCPQDGVSVRFGRPHAVRAAGINLGRRQLLGTVFAGLAVALLPKGSIEAKDRLRRRFLRPPGAVREKEFLARCVRCGQCVQACPTSFIQPAFLEAAFDGIWTPVLNARAGYCAFECNRCTQVCPTGAIARLTLPEKKAYKVGTAAIDKNRCFTYADGFNCTACIDRCPVPGNALKLREVETFDFHGRRVLVRQVYVVADLCTGCGICEHVCPRGGPPGIVVTAEDEAREGIT